MTESAYKAADRCRDVLKLDFSADEFARLAADNSYSVEAIAAINDIFGYASLTRRTPVCSST